MLPELVRVAVFATLWPTSTLPKASEAGLSARLPGGTALPDTATSISPAVAAPDGYLPCGFTCRLWGERDRQRHALAGTRVNGIAGEVSLNEASDAAALAIDPFQAALAFVRRGGFWRHVPLCVLAANQSSIPATATAILL